MENRIYEKKFLISSLLILIVLALSIFTIIAVEYNFNKAILNQKMSALIAEVKTEYPGISDDKILDILAGDKTNDEPLSKYGYDLKKDSLIRESDRRHLHFYVITVGVILFTFFGFTIIFYFYLKRQNTEIDQLITTLEKINQKNYDLELDSINEDKLSILKSEIYKTTVMLKEAASFSEKSKIELKNSLSDISHQLKTPLTSILIMLDDILADEKMPTKTRNEFLNTIRKNVINTNSLIQNILKLSKFDADAVEFTRTKIDPEDIVDAAIENTAIIADLKNVKIEKKIGKKRKVSCDISWQKEALSNIIKNAIEHSKSNSKVTISIDSYELYIEIKVIDSGSGITKEDIKHVFKRFYKCSNSSVDSVGIGLSLAKTIIEKDSGSISVSSVPKMGTTFKIRYY